MGKTLYIINPSSHGGAGSKAWEGFKAMWPDEIDSEDVIITSAPGQAREIAAAHSGYEMIVVVGGDGSVGEVISGVMERREPRPKVAVIPGGTGNDFARNVGIFSLADSVAALLGKQFRTVDLLRIDCQKEGVARRSYGCLFANAGFSSVPMMRPWMKRLLGAKGAYYLATCLQIFAYHAPHMTIRVDDQEFADDTYMLIAGNSEWAGGGSMRISPGARIDDGQLNVTIAPTMSKMKIISRLLPGIAKGSHINEPGIFYLTGKKIEVQSEPPAVVDVDGDLLGTTPATFTLCPRVLQVIAIEKTGQCAG